MTIWQLNTYIFTIIITHIYNWTILTTKHSPSVGLLSLVIHTLASFAKGTNIHT